MERIDVAVIGAGVTGLASGRALARRGLSVCVLERHPRPGLDTSTHNSGVIHAGIYYPAGTLKASLCVEGCRLLYEFCARHHVPHVKCGKLIVATNPVELSRMGALKERASIDGIKCHRVDRDELTRLEPNVTGLGALYLPSTGIVDYRKVSRKLAELISGSRGP